MNRSLKRRFTRNPAQMGAELENHFILRLPPVQANTMRDLLRSNQSSNIKDRLNIQLDYTADKDDMRNGIITVDTMMYKSRLVDMPTLLESWKTIDGKNFYKTSDICQMLMVKDGDDPQEEEESKKKKKDHPNRVDKKYLWPHGYTPPLKNVRKRRFRKMLRKKILELPEIEKEVKRLLRADEEALSVKWEVLREDEDKGGLGDGGQEGGDSRAPANLDEQLFGEMVSSSEDEVGPTINIMDEDEDSRLSVDDTRFSEPYTQDVTNSPLPSSSRQLYPSNTSPRPPSRHPNTPPHHIASPPHHHDLPSTSAQQAYITEFNPSMFRSSNDATSAYNSQSNDISMFGMTPSVALPTSSGGPSVMYDAGDHSSMYGMPAAGHGASASSMFNVGGGLEGYDCDDDTAVDEEEDSSTMLLTNMAPAAADFVAIDNRDRSVLAHELTGLECELRELLGEQSERQAHMNSLDNLALKTRFLAKLQDIATAIRDKEGQISRLRSALQH